MNLDKIQLRVLNQVAIRHGVPVSEVKKVYLGTFKFIKDTLGVSKIREASSQEELDNLKTNFNLPMLGKLHIMPKKALFLNEKLKQLNNKEDE